jgi:hypothetical protein
MTLAERLQHAVLISCFVLLVVTGLPLLSRPTSGTSGLFIFDWGFRLRGILHRIGGVGLIAVSLFHLYYISSTRRGREIFLALMPRLKDATDALQAFGHNLGFSEWLRRKGILKNFFDRHPFWLFAEAPQYGRYNFIEKFEYLAVIWGNFDDYRLSWTTTLIKGFPFGFMTSLRLSTAMQQSWPSWPLSYGICTVHLSPGIFQW